MTFIRPAGHGKHLVLRSTLLSEKRNEFHTQLKQRTTKCGLSNRISYEVHCNINSSVHEIKEISVQTFKRSLRPFQNSA